MATLRLTLSDLSRGHPLRHLLFIAAVFTLACGQERVTLMPPASPKLDATGPMPQDTTQSAGDTITSPFQDTSTPSSDISDAVSSDGFSGVDARRSELPQSEDLPTINDTTDTELPESEDGTDGSDVTADTQALPTWECCSAQTKPSCSDTPCAQAVCEIDSYCCTDKWDSICVSCAQGKITAIGDCNGVDTACGCEAPPPPVIPKASCCELGKTAGCTNSQCEDAVCFLDPYCCSTKWDGSCVKCAKGQQTSSAEGSCASVVNKCGCAPAPPPNPKKSCCEPNAGPGCLSTACELAVCKFNDECCKEEWSSYCVKCAQGQASSTAENTCQNFDKICECEPPPVTHKMLAEHWSPVWYHDTDDTDYDAEYITAFDFDGDLISSNNWENQAKPGADLSAVIYWWLIETKTHWFIGYADFHPRDWDDNCDPFFPWLEPCHENDMEGALVMVRKDGSSYGQFEVLYTEAHNALHMFTNSPQITKGSNEHFEDVKVSFENESHPELYVEAKGHGVCALYFDGPSHCKHPVDQVPPKFPGGDGIVYRYKGKAETPKSGNDKDVGYDLVPLETTLWKHRNHICNDLCLFDGTFTYESVKLSKSFDGDTWGDDKANPPWAWDDPKDGDVFRGDFFFRPAETAKTHANFPKPVSTEYIYNPFLKSLE